MFGLVPFLSSLNIRLIRKMTYLKVERHFFQKRKPIWSKGEGWEFGLAITICSYSSNVMSSMLHSCCTSGRGLSPSGRLYCRPKFSSVQPFFSSFCRSAAESCGLMKESGCSGLTMRLTYASGSLWKDFSSSEQADCCWFFFLILWCNRTIRRCFVLACFRSFELPDFFKFLSSLRSFVFSCSS
eukprot:Lithocolla_globosa_v1_NODE_191_length_5320_cov_8.118139.p3 type:complete len:184 gc:universal NODE_191_length_5320_cov_8.118139:1747-1196(-)